MHRANSRFGVQVDDEDIPKLCTKHVPIYLQRFNLFLKDVQLDRMVAGSPARPRPQVGRDLGTDFGDTSSQLPREELASSSSSISALQAPDTAIGEESVILIEELITRASDSFEAAVGYLKNRGINLQFRALPSGQEFSHEELVLLCGCGALYQKRYRNLHRAQEVSDLMDGFANGDLTSCAVLERHSSCALCKQGGMRQTDTERREAGYRE